MTPATGARKIAAISGGYAGGGTARLATALGVRAMQVRAYQRCCEHDLLIKSPPASGEGRARMFIAPGKLYNRGMMRAIAPAPAKTIGARFHDEPRARSGVERDGTAPPKRTLCNAPGEEDGGKINFAKDFVGVAARILICSHAPFRNAVGGQA